MQNLPNASTLKQYAIYIRVSSEQQTRDGDSIEMQEDLAREVVNENNGQIYKVYVDASVSASKTDIEDRPALVELLADAKAKKFDAIIVFKRDRLARNPAHSARLRAEFKKYKIEVVYSAKGEIAAQGDDALGEYIEDQLALMAKLESALIAQRTSAVLKNKVKKGERVGGKLPYGYILENDKVILVEEEVKVIHEIEQLYIDGLGEYAITRWLNGKEVRGKGKRDFGEVKRFDRTKKKPVSFTKEVVRYILTNPFYCGKILYNKRDSYNRKRDKSEWIISQGEHQPCRTEELHQKLQDVRKSKEEKRKPPRFYNTDYLLTGFIYCKCCGSKWCSRNATKNGKQYHWYTCGSWRGTKFDQCRSKWIEKDLLEQFVINEITKFSSAFNLETLQKEIDKKFNIREGDVSETLKKIQNELKDLEETRKINMKLQEQAMKNEDDEELEEYRERQQEIRAQIKELKGRKIELEKIASTQQQSLNTAMTLYDSLRHFIDVFENSSHQVKKTVLEGILNRIEIDENAVVNIKYNLDLNEPLFGVSFGAQQLMDTPKDTTKDEFNLTLDIIGDFNNWTDDIYNKIKNNFKEWLIKNGQVLIGEEKVTASKLSKATGIPKHNFDNYLYNNEIPRKLETIQLITMSLGTSVEKMIEEIGINADPEIIWGIIQHKQSRAS